MTVDKKEEGYLRSRRDASGPYSAAINTLFADYDKPGHPGLHLSVLKDDYTIHRRGYGVAEIEHDIPFLPDETVLRLGSTSKHFCAYLILQLEQQGKLSVTDDVRKHVPEMPDLGVRMTLDHLMTMTSGLPDWLNLALFSGLREGGPMQRADILEWLPRLDRLMFKPGETVSYSNTNYALLSLIIERITGQPLAQVMEQRIFKPLNMSRTRLVTYMSETVPGMAKGYIPGEDGKPVAGLMMPELSGDGGIVSSLIDMTRWYMRWHIGHAFDVPLRDGLAVPTYLTDGSIADYRRGIVVTETNGVTRIGHGGGMPGYLSEFAHYPELDVGVIMLTNWMDVSLMGKIDAIAEIVSERKFAPGPAELKPDQAFEAAAGLYVSQRTGQALSLTSEGGKQFVFILGEAMPVVAGGGGFYSPTKRGGSRRIKIVSRDRVELYDGALAPDTFEKCEAPLAIADPSRYTGTYRSRVLGEHHTIAWDGKNLRVSTGSPLRPLVWSRLSRRAGEVFTAPIDSEPSESNVTLKFTIGSDGKASGFEYNISRVHALTFDRVSA